MQFRSCTAMKLSCRNVVWCVCQVLVTPAIMTPQKLLLSCPCKDYSCIREQLAWSWLQPCTLNPKPYPCFWTLKSVQGRVFSRQSAGVDRPSMGLAVTADAEPVHCLWNTFGKAKGIGMLWGVTQRCRTHLLPARQSSISHRRPCPGPSSSIGCHDAKKQH